MGVVMKQRCRDGAVNDILEENGNDGMDLIDAVLANARVAFLEAIVAPLRSAEPNMASKNEAKK
jgi:hypothetical protein